MIDGCIWRGEKLYHVYYCTNVLCDCVPTLHIVHAVRLRFHEHLPTYLFIKDERFSGVTSPRLSVSLSLFSFLFSLEHAQAPQSQQLEGHGLKYLQYYLHDGHTLHQTETRLSWARGLNLRCGVAFITILH